jgi:hypothetical protein
MRKFTKILESLDSELVQDIKDIFVEFLDKGIELKTIDEFQGIYKIRLYKYKYSNIDHMFIIKELNICDDKLRSALNLDYISSGITLEHDLIDIKLKYSLKETDNLRSKDVNGWKEFKAYCQDVLGVDGIQGKKNDHSWFRINVASEEGFCNKEYFGWEIEPAITHKAFVNEYPGYEDFLRKILKRRLNWDGVWDREELKSTENNALKFDKEGIEVVEKLLEMAKDFPDKIEVTKPRL